MRLPELVGGTGSLGWVAVKAVLLFAVAVIGLRFGERRTLAHESPREQMESEWRDIRGRATWSPEASTTHVYQKYVSGKPRMSSARAALDYFHVPNAGDMAAIGIARAGEARLLAAAGADIVVSTLDHVGTTALAAGRLATRKT